MENKEINHTANHRHKPVFVEGPIEPAFVGVAIGKHSANTTIGAHSIFLGQVRSDVLDGRTVTAIEYSAYVDMAEEKFREIREAAFAKYPLTCMHLYHSLGRVGAGEISLFVFTSGKHRREAIDACNEVVERIKQEVPVWGKEIFDDETYTWKENK
ncbi:MAG: molybdenum cofactor biosynthesis protein MoaE [Saprospiraceae bacterium]